MTAKKTGLRGVNRIPARSGFSRGAASPAQSASMLARLERQKTLLEKQLRVWIGQQVLTERRLRTVQAQISAVAADLRKAQSAPAEVRLKPKPGSVAAAAGRPRRRSDTAFTF